MRYYILLILCLMFSASYASADEFDPYKAFEYRIYNHVLLKKLLFLAEQGDALAQTKLGYMYEHGIVVNKNTELALNWYVKAVELGHMRTVRKVVNLLNDIAFIEHRKPTQISAWVNKAKEKAIEGNSDAQVAVGTIYYYGEAGEKNHDKAAYWFRKAAEHGNVDALYWMWEIEGYEKQNEEKAQYWITALTKLAEQENTSAQKKLAQIYRSQCGDKKGKHPEAAMWYKRAAEKGDIEAQESLVEMYSRDNSFGTGCVEHDEAEATRWTQHIAKQMTVIHESMLKHEGLTGVHYVNISLSSGVLDFPPLLLEKAPLAIKITGPDSLVTRGLAKHTTYAGCLYNVDWDDGTHDPPYITDCSSSFEHVYERPGVYVVEGQTWDQAPNDAPINEWVGKAVVIVR